MGFCTIEIPWTSDESSNKTVIVSIPLQCPAFQAAKPVGQWMNCKTGTGQSQELIKHEWLWAAPLFTSKAIGSKQNMRWGLDIDWFYHSLERKTSLHNDWSPQFFESFSMSINTEWLSKRCNGSIQTDAAFTQLIIIDANSLMRYLAYKHWF